MAPTTEERISQLEQAVVRLSRITEQRSGPYERDVNQYIAHQGQLLNEWVAEVADET